jgi:hypothetical protein
LCGSLESSTLIRHAEIAVFVVGHSRFGIQSEFGWERLLGKDDLHGPKIY